jgi:predicted aldo/keto reductase-like oxidoreductase
MERRYIGRTGVRLSVIGFGTAQLQMLPERQALAALRRGFECGINWVHTAPDYGGVEHWIARAIAESGRPVSVVTQSPAFLSLLEPYFENTCRLFGRRALDLYGLNCIEDIERIGENVWGKGGMIEFLQRKKAEGRLRAIFCSTHGAIDYVERLVDSGVFDALMVAYNPIGFHQLSYFAEKQQRQFENMHDTAQRLFPRAAARGVSLIIMKALGGGLLSRGKAFPPHLWPAPDEIPPADLLRFALEQPGVASVVPGIASPEEAEENAAAGVAPLGLEAPRRARLLETAARMRLSLCSRCGACESTCSRELPIASLFRDGYIWNYRNETFMADNQENYFDLHPDPALACVTCDNQSCRCPQGLAVPEELLRLHTLVASLRAAGRHPGPIAELAVTDATQCHRVRLVSREVPESAPAGTAATAVFLLENAGEQMWTAMSHIPDPRIATAVGIECRGRIETVPLRQNISPGQRSAVAVEFMAPREPGDHDVSFFLMPMAAGAAGRTRFFATRLHVVPGP